MTSEEASSEDPEIIAEAIEDAAENMTDAKITMFRPLLVQHNAGKALAQVDTDAPPTPTADT